MPGTIASMDLASAKKRKEQRNALIASFLGWTLDAFDFFIVVMVLTEISRDFKRSYAEMAFTLSVTLAFRPVGAFIFGLLADRYGRRIPLMIDVIFYSVIEIASGLAPNYTTFLVLAGALRHRDGWGMGSRGFAGNGGGAVALARHFIRRSSGGLCDRLSHGFTGLSVCFSRFGMAGDVLYRRRSCYPCLVHSPQGQRIRGMGKNAAQGLERALGRGPLPSAEFILLIAAGVALLDLARIQSSPDRHQFAKVPPAERTPICCVPARSLLRRC